MAITVNTKFYIKQNDLLPDLSGQFKDELTGTPQPLTGATLEFHMKDETGTVVINQPAAVVDSALGKWKYEWQAGDTADAGRFEGEVQAMFAGKPLTGPNRKVGFSIIITPEIA